MLLKNDRALKRWLKFEASNINSNLVSHQVIITDLLKMEKPMTMTKNGEEYYFNIEALGKFRNTISNLHQRRLKLPVFIYKDLRVRDSCFISDKTAFSALLETKDLDPMYKFENDKVWFSRVIGHDIARKYPTLFQFVVF
jgi:uncharacterized protein (UPF0216 family)